MDKIIFKAVFGDHEKEVELSSPSGGAGGYFVLIDRYYLGTIFKRNGIWTGILNDDGLTAADVTELGAIIDQENQLM